MNIANFVQPDRIARLKIARATIISISYILTLAENQAHRLQQHLVWLGSNLKVRLEDTWCPQLSGSQEVIRLQLHLKEAVKMCVERSSM